MQIGMVDEPCRGEDLRQAPVLGIRVLRSRREEPVAFSATRLRVPPRVILKRARIAQRLSHVLIVPGPDVRGFGRTNWSERLLSTVWTPSKTREAVSALSIPSAANARWQMASIAASPGSLGLSSTFEIQVLSA